MQRSITTWMACKPSEMAHNQSRSAIQFAFEDMRADIISLHTTLLQFARDAVCCLPENSSHHQRARRILDELK